MLLRNLILFSFPQLCPACKKALDANEKLLCADCRLTLPVTNFHLLTENPVIKMFWGRIPLEYAMSYLYYSKQSRVQRLIHHIKYHGLKELAVEIGEMMGRAIQENEDFSRQIDCVVPVPLHPRKLKKRGFNQSECLANGICEILQKPLLTDNLIRLIHNPTQTRKNRLQRWENVSGIFGLRNPQEFTGKHILLVDDVITTGSTIEACFVALKEANEIKLSLASIGFAHDT